MSKGLPLLNISQHYQWIDDGIRNNPSLNSQYKPPCDVAEYYQVNFRFEETAARRDNLTNSRDGIFVQPQTVSVSTNRVAEVMQLAKVRRLP